MQGFLQFLRQEVPHGFSVAHLQERKGGGLPIGIGVETPIAVDAIPFSAEGAGHGVLYVEADVVHCVLLDVALDGRVNVRQQE